MKKILLLALIVVIPLTLLIVANLPMQQMPGNAFMNPDGAYVNTEHLFMLRPPAGWTMTEKFPPEMAVSAIVSFELREAGRVNPLPSMMGMWGDARANVMVRVWRWATTVDNVIALMKRPGRALTYKIKSEGPVMVGGMEGYRLHYSWGPFLKLEAGEHVEHYVAKGGKIFVISYMTFKDVPFETHFSTADAAIKSVRFLEKVTVDVKNGSVVVDGRRYDKLPTTLYLNHGEPHTLVAEPLKSFWPWADSRYTFAGWGDGDASPSRTVIITKPETFTARFVTR